VVDRAPLIEAMLDIALPDTIFFVSGPRQFPRHFDPIDTMFRPTPEELFAEFPGTNVVASAVIDSGNWRSWRAEERGGRTLARTLARLAVPFYRPRRWWELAIPAPFLFRNISAVAAVLRVR